MTTGAITSPKANEKTKAEPETLLKKLTLCNVQSLSINAIQCLFSGVTQEAAFQKIVESALKAMDVDVMGFFIQSLPPAKQSELREMARQKWADMPMPWEEGYKSGSSEDANPYLNYLGTKSDQGVEALKNKLNADLSEINNQISEKESQIENERSFLEMDRDTRRLVSDDEDGDFDTNQNRKISKLQMEFGQLEIAQKDIQEQLKQFEEEDFSKLPSERQQELINAQTQAQGTLGTALGDIQSELVDMYIENMLDVVGYDELMSHLDRFPGGQLVQRYINQVRCAFQGLHNPPIKSFLSTLSFDPCGDGNLGLSFPEKMRDFNFRDLKPWKKDFLMILRNKFIDKLETVLTQILVRMILKLIKTVDDALCKSINAAGQFAAGLVTGNNQGLDEAVKGAFCPNADEDLDKIKENLFNNALGKGGVDFKLQTLKHMTAYSRQ